MEYLFAIIVFFSILGVKWVREPERKKTEKTCRAPAEPDRKETAREESTMALNTISLIAEAFDSHEIKYRVTETEDISFIEAGYGISGGPTVRFLFFVRPDNGNDVQMRISGLMNKVGSEKRGVILEACNRVNNEMRFLKFYLDKDGDLFGQSDIPSAISADCVGECCFELFVRSMQILDRCYHYFPEAYYSSPTAEKSELLLNTLNALKDLRDNPITIPTDAERKDRSES